MSANAALLCPITHCVMIDPVKAPDGHSYERSAIEQAIRTNGRSPITRQPLRIADLVTDYTLKSVIEQLTAAPTMKPDEQVPEVIQAVVRSDGVRTQLTLSSPDGEAGPLDVCFVVDISGSMQLEVTTASGESDGFSVLDVVKHGITTCICGLRPEDRAAIVVYSTDARVLVPLCRTDAAGKARIKVALAGLDPENSTNIWAGLRLGLEQLPDGGTVFLLTDGQPNCRPPRGELGMLRAACDGRDDIVVNTYGFGYNLDSKLLVELARATQGAYSFIPDIGLVGTVFIHAMANLRTSVRRKLTVCLETEGTLQLPELVKASWGYVLPIGRITKGQPRDIFIECTSPVSITVQGVDVTVSDAAPTASDTQDAALGILQCHAMARIEPTQANTVLNGLLASITSPALQEDLNGQVREAIEPTAYKKWGRHYLPSLAVAHMTQQCNNFLDKGLQAYGGPAFQAVRDQLDAAFNELPAPQPAHRAAVVHRMRSAGHTVTAAPARMTSYNSAAGPCFAGPCRVKMSDGSLKTCQDITAGNVVETSNGNATVVCVLKTPCETAQLVKVGRLMVTPFHPIKVEGQWTFPAQVGAADEYPCDAVYSFLLEPGHCDMRIEEVPCITLAHGIENDDVATHPFYGTQAVVDAMSADAGFGSGLVMVRSVRRDAQTGLACGFEF